MRRAQKALGFLAALAVLGISLALASYAIPDNNSVQIVIAGLGVAAAVLLFVEVRRS